MMTVAHNLLAMNGNRMLGINSKKKAGTTEKLSSGYRVNRSADDAAGLAISEKMRRQVRGLTQASQNIQDGVSFCQVADGYLNEVHDILHRITELAVKSENGTNTPEDRAYMDEEVQELKKELQRIFKNADFNEIKIWDEPYAPEPSIDPLREPDIQVFNSGISAGEPVYGGVEINDVRHTWAELGIAVSGNVFAADNEVEFTDYTGERIKLKVKAGDPLSNVTRNYNWRADTNGIYVNEKLAATWSSMGIGATDNSGSYSFQYSNFDISFSVKDGDSLADIISGINGQVLSSGYTWDMSSPGITDTSQKAVDITIAQTVPVTERNKNIIDLDYQIHADTIGVSILDSNHNTHTEIQWGLFDDTSIPSVGSYPISDWGLSDIDGQGQHSSLVTFDDAAQYTYTDTEPSDLNLSFTFQLGDEASRDAVIAGLNGVTFSNYVSAPGSSAQPATSFGVNQPGISVTTNALNGNNDLKQAYGMDPTDATSTIEGSITRTFCLADDLDADGDHYGYFVYSGNLGGNAMQSVIGQSFKVPVNPAGAHTLTDTVNVTTALGDTMTLQYQNDLMNLTQMTSSITYRADESIDPISIDSSDASSVTLSPADDYLRNNFQLQRSFGRNFSSSSPSINGTMTRTFVRESDTKGHFEYSGTFGSRTLDTFIGDSFDLPVDQNASPWTDEVLVKSGGDTAMKLSYTSDLHNLSTVSSDLKFQPDGQAARMFYAEENTADNVNGATIYTDVTLLRPKRQLDIQAGTEPGQHIELKWDILSNGIIGIGGTNVLTQQTAGAAIWQVKNAMKIVSEERSDFGAYQNRLEHAKKIDENVAENTTAAESRIRDADMAKEMMDLARQNILEQVSQSVLSQANQTPQGVMSLLQ